jgi:hypothetical protein
LEVEVFCTGLWAMSTRELARYCTNCIVWVLRFDADLANAQILAGCLQPFEITLKLADLQGIKPARVYAKLRIFRFISFLAINATLQRFHETNELYGN